MNVMICTGRWSPNTRERWCSSGEKAEPEIIDFWSVLTETLRKRTALLIEAGRRFVAGVGACVGAARVTQVVMQPVFI